MHKKTPEGPGVFWLFGKYCDIFRNNLPIRDVYRSMQWSLGSVERYSIFTNAGGYPIKGHHILFQALGYVKEIYPDFKCYIPGEKLSSFDGIKRRTGYAKMLNDLIRKYNLYFKESYANTFPIFFILL